MVVAVSTCAISVPGATLVLLNSRRTVRDAVTLTNVDVNSLVPPDHDRSRRDPERRRLVDLRIGRGRRRRELPHPQQLRRVRGDRPGRHARGTATTPTIAPRLSGDRRANAVASPRALEYFNRSPYDWQDLRLINEQVDGPSTDSGAWRDGPLVTPSPIAMLPAPLPAPARPSPTRCARSSPRPPSRPARRLTRQGVTYPSNCCSEHGLRPQLQRRRSALSGRRRNALRHRRGPHLLRRSAVPAYAARRSATTRPPPWHPGPGQPERHHSRLRAEQYRSAPLNASGAPLYAQKQRRPACATTRTVSAGTITCPLATPPVR